MSEKNLSALPAQTNQSLQPRISIYWDYQNVKGNPYLAKYFLSFANLKGYLVSTKAYANWRAEKLDYEERIYELGFDCIDVPLRTKNSVDQKLIADCSGDIVTNSSSEVVILVTGDGDFIPLVKSLQERGKKVIIFAQRGKGSQKLIALANEVHFVEKLPELIEEDLKSQTISYSDAIKSLIAAITQALIQKKPTTFAYINNLMLKKFPNYLGVSSIRKADGTKFRYFSKFVDSVARDGKVQVRQVQQSKELFLI